MAKPQYTGTYLAIRKAWAPIVERGEAVCSEPVCLMPTRTIYPGSRWDLCHDSDGGIRGPGHPKCNRADGAIRGNKARATRFLRL